MPSLLQYVLDFRIDALAYGLVVIVAAWWHRRWHRRVLPGSRPGIRVRDMVLVYLPLGLLAAEWAAHHRREQLINAISGIGPTYAFELKKLGHAAITTDTPPDDPRYRRLIQAEKDWLAINPTVGDIYTYRKSGDGLPQLIVDSETDYNHDGVIAGEREARTAIGETFDDPAEKAVLALDGRQVFDGNIATDRWGTWVSSYTPLYNDAGLVEAAVGVDFPAMTWLRLILGDRLVVFGIAIIVIASLLVRSVALARLQAAALAHHRVEAERERDILKVEVAERVKRDVAGVMSHEIRTPLNAVVGFSSMLADTSLNLTQRRYVETIVGAADRLVTLLDDSFDLSQTEETRLPIRRVPYSPALIVREMLALLEPSFATKQISLRLDDRVEAVLNVAIDPLRIRQVLLNLVGNAIKYTDRGTVTVRVAWEDGARDHADGILTLVVADTGCGMRPDQVQTLFQPVSLDDRSVVRRQGGSSLGLAVCRRVVDAMGGKLAIASRVGEGTSITVTLPCSRADRSDLKPKDAAPARAAQGARLRVLVVDDHKVNCDLLQVIVRRLGYDADAAGGGREAVELASRHAYVAILTDLDMPELDGFGVARHVRANETLGRRVPIVAISASTEKGTRERCFAAGMDEYLTKPVYIPALKATLEAVLRSGDNEAQATPVPKGPGKVTSMVHVETIDRR